MMTVRAKFIVFSFCFFFSHQGIAGSVFWFQNIRFASREECERFGDSLRSTFEKLVRANEHSTTSCMLDQNQGDFFGAFEVEDFEDYSINLSVDKGAPYELFNVSETRTSLIRIFDRNDKSTSESFRTNSYSVRVRERYLGQSFEVCRFLLRKLQTVTPDILYQLRAGGVISSELDVCSSDGQFINLHVTVTPKDLGSMTSTRSVSAQPASLFQRQAQQRNISTSVSSIAELGGSTMEVCEGLNQDRVQFFESIYGAEASFTARCESWDNHGFPIIVRLIENKIGLTEESFRNESTIVNGTLDEMVTVGDGWLTLLPASPNYLYEDCKKQNGIIQSLYEEYYGVEVFPYCDQVYDRYQRSAIIPAPGQELVPVGMTFDDLWQKYLKHLWSSYP